MSDHPEPTRGLTMVFSDAVYAHDSGEYALGGGGAESPGMLLQLPPIDPKDAKK